MPIMDGYHAIQEIRNITETKKNSIPIVALTAHATEGEREKCIDAGADDCLSKPFQPEELLNMIKSMTKIKDKNEQIIELKNHKTMENFDIKTLREFTSNKETLIVSTLQLLSETLIEDEIRLSNALESNNVKILKSIAHKMKPNFYLLGLNKLGESCDDIGLTDSSTEYINVLSSVIIKSIPEIISRINIELNSMIEMKN